MMRGVGCVVEREVLGGCIYRVVMVIFRQRRGRDPCFASTLTLSRLHVISRNTSTVPKERFHGAKRNEVSTYLRIYLVVNYTFPSLHETTCL